MDEPPSLEAITAGNNINATGHAKENDITIQVWDLCEMTYSNHTGAFLLQLYHIYLYIMVLVKIDSSRILMETLKDRSSKELT